MLASTYQHYVMEPELTTRVSVRLPAQVVAALDRVARECVSARSDVIREYLAESLPEEYLEDT